MLTTNIFVAQFNATDYHNHTPSHGCDDSGYVYEMAVDVFADTLVLAKKALEEKFLCQCPNVQRKATCCLSFLPQAVKWEEKKNITGESYWPEARLSLMKFLGNG